MPTVWTAFCWASARRSGSPCWDPRVAATVALVDLGRGHPESSSHSGTPWLLYAVIGVSALVIIGAIPLLVRARRAALADPRAGRGAGTASGRPPGRPRPRRGFQSAQTEKLRVYRPGADPTPARSADRSPRRSARSTPRCRRSGSAVAALRRGHRVRHGRGAAGRRHRHLPDGRGARPARLDALTAQQARHVGDAAQSRGSTYASCVSCWTRSGV